MACERCIHLHRWIFPVLHNGPEIMTTRCFTPQYGWRGFCIELHRLQHSALKPFISFAHRLFLKFAATWLIFLDVQTASTLNQPSLSLKICHGARQTSADSGTRTKQSITYSTLWRSSAGCVFASANRSTNRFTYTSSNPRKFWARLYSGWCPVRLTN